MPSDVQSLIAEFLAKRPFAVVGASRHRDKYGNKVLRAYQQHALKVYPVHPREAEIEGLAAYPTLADLPEPARGVSVITPPAVTEKIVDEVIRLGIQWIWMQPGAESAAAIARAKAAGVNVIAGGPCVLVALHYHE